VKSGHNDTTMGNTIVNALIALEAVVACGLRASIIVAGDDLLVAVDGAFDEHAVAAVERGCGIVPEYRKFHSWSDVSFISGMWWYAGGIYNFTPKLGRLLARLWWTVHPPGRKHFHRYRAGVSKGLAPTVGPLPIYSALLGQHVVDSIVPADKRFDFVYGRAVAWPGDLVALVAERYGLTSEEVVDADRVLRQTDRPCVVIHPTLEWITRRDTCDLAERVELGL